MLFVVRWSSCLLDAVYLKDELRDIIEEGNHERLELLQGDGARELVETKYGGSNGGADMTDLYSGTLPLLHAARRGRPRIFSALLKYLEVCVKRDLLLSTGVFCCMSHKPHEPDQDPGQHVTKNPSLSYMNPAVTERPQCSRPI